MKARRGGKGLEEKGEGKHCALGKKGASDGKLKEGLEVGMRTNPRHIKTKKKKKQGVHR